MSCASEADIEWVCKTFDELSPHELYASLRLRLSVFIVEGFAGKFQDADNRDQKALHLLGFDKHAKADAEDKLAAYCRIFAPDVIYPGSAAIGRVCCRATYRRQGIGRKLMVESFEQVATRFGRHTPIEIGAQLYLQAFYESLGFVREGEVYVDGDNIDHVHMKKMTG